MTLAINPAMNLGVVILAAGQGTRMRSDRPKVLHELAGRPLLRHVIDTAGALQPARIAVVYGHGGEQVPAALADSGVTWVEQARQLGTGHAVEQALPALDGVERVLVLYGDVPLTAPATLHALVRLARETPLALLTVTLDDPTGYGRILRDPQGRVLRIVEHKDASPEERAVREVNTGILVAERSRLAGWLQRVENANSQGEFYLTDIVALAVAEGVAVQTAQPASVDEVLGVNDRGQLAHLERVYQRQQAEALMRQGVTLRDPARFDLRGRLEAGRDVEIDINCLLEGEVSLGDRVRVGANTVLRNVRVAADTLIRENCVIEDAVIGPDCRIGPFSRIRPDSELAGGVHVGNFVEIKKSQVAQGSKINHLSYIGDTEMGAGVNIGAGTITCNYDGANKHLTRIGDRAFIGSNTALVAPLAIGAGATIGAGSTITRDAPAEELTLTRAKQATIPGWRRPTKKG
jgi:bifunctional UDP-N-acetylglucosamine pyrophosphorylase / glucosamine-1-phosphate N-acetyltransferase